MNESIYAKGFAAFLAHTNEKEVLLREIGAIADTRNCQSLLDIGAGNGDLSIPLSRRIPKYIAVEKLPEYVDKLRNVGIEVIEGRFPCPVPGRFDIVLASHSVGAREAVYRPFLENAWALVKEKGALVIVTYRQDGGDWRSLLNKVRFSRGEHELTGYDGIVKVVSNLGKVDTLKVPTSVNISSKEEMFNALTFVASNGIEQFEKEFLDRRGAVEDILEQDYSKEGGYSFPFDHYILKVDKT